MSPAGIRAGRRRSAVAAALALVGLLSLSGCGGESADAAPKAAPASVAPAPPPPAAPALGSCHQLTLPQATQPVDDAAAVPCAQPHSTVTFKVGALTPLVDGHLLAVDSAAVRNQIAQACPRALPGYLGGSTTTQRLSRFQAVWFSPSLKQSDAGASWFRCDVVALQSQGQLMPLRGPIKNILARPNALATYGTCGTSAPDQRGFTRVACAQRHSWVAFDVVNLPARAGYLAKPVTSASQATCKDKAMARKPSALKHTWSFEWPSPDQWAAGQRYGYCWMPA